jgi:hypothetical protein
VISPVPHLLSYASCAISLVPYVNVLLLSYYTFVNDDVVVQISCSACKIFLFDDVVEIQIYCSASKLLYLFNAVVLIHIYGTTVFFERWWTSYF